MKSAEINAIISPRASIEGAVNLALGLTEHEAIETCLIKGMTRDTQNIIKAKLS